MRHEKSSKILHVYGTYEALLSACDDSTLTQNLDSDTLKKVLESMKRKNPESNISPPLELNSEEGTLIQDIDRLNYLLCSTDKNGLTIEKKNAVSVKVTGDENEAKKRIKERILADRKVVSPVQSIDVSDTVLGNRMIENLIQNFKPTENYTQGQIFGGTLIGTFLPAVITKSHFHLFKNSLEKRKYKTNLFVYENNARQLCGFSSFYFPSDDLSSESGFCAVGIIENVCSIPSERKYHLFLNPTARNEFSKHDINALTSKGLKKALLPKDKYKDVIETTINSDIFVTHIMENYVPKSCFESQPIIFETMKFKYQQQIFYPLLSIDLLAGVSMLVFTCFNISSKTTPPDFLMGSLLSFALIALLCMAIYSSIQNFKIPNKLKKLDCKCNNTFLFAYALINTISCFSIIFFSLILVSITANWNISFLNNQTWYSKSTAFLGLSTTCLILSISTLLSTIFLTHLKLSERINRMQDKNVKEEEGIRLTAVSYERSIAWLMLSIAFLFSYMVSSKMMLSSNSIKSYTLVGGLFLIGMILMRVSAAGEFTPSWKSNWHHVYRSTSILYNTFTNHPSTFGFEKKRTVNDDLKNLSKNTIHSKIRSKL